MNTEISMLGCLQTNVNFNSSSKDLYDIMCETLARVCFIRSEKFSEQLTTREEENCNVVEHGNLD